MAELRVHDVEINRVPPQQAVRVHQVTITRVPVVPDKILQVHDLWITRGYEPPISGGARRVRWGGQWVTSTRRVRLGGQWI